ncbi:hypothetical protein A2635_00635 [Candidatus Peribacteria bacterium RIFCSPHIGHO2_01_FULL_51_9]|nr:MAG: hypothetical protein A2635_00635 [Candidatus Peribacteria bacterium RIFCSPHIGHO2_01_FULL_51_9]
MIYVFITLFVTTLLIIEGRLLFGIIGKTRDERMIAWSLGLPLGTLVNALIFFVIHLAGISFTAISIGAGHFVILFVLWLFFSFSTCRSFETLCQKMCHTEGSDQDRLEVRHIFWQSPQDDTLRMSHPQWQRSLSILCIAFITLTLLSAFIYATVLPSFYWDTFTHWAMRAKQSLYAESFISEGVIQPQYPILMHSLMMLPAVFAGWNNQWVHLVTFFLSLSQTLSIFLIIQKRYSRETALIILTLLLSVPFVAIHLRQGYADIHVTFFILLSALFLDAWSKERSSTLLTLSALLCAAAAWTKFEGLYFGVLPWIGIVGWKMIRSKNYASILKNGIVPIIITSFFWPLYVLLSGMPPSPHTIQLAANIDAFPMILKSLFLMGSFGLHWWAIIIASITLLIVERKHIFKITTEHPSIIWADTALILLVGIYIFTSESEGLTVGHNFSRAMILPTLLYTQSLAVLCMESLRARKIQCGVRNGLL